MFKVKTLNNIVAAGINQFDSNHYLVDSNVEDPDAILVRSFNMHELDLPQSLQIVGRAGAGTNNIPISKLTQLGIPVLNTPGANANAVKELVIAGMLLSCRNLLTAWDFVQKLECSDNSELSKTVEQSKKQFAGSELPGKTLGIIGLGHIGVKVANAAVDLDMRVIGFDPAMTVRNAWELSSSVIQAESMTEVIRQADYLSVHVPLVDSTRGLINATALAQAKQGLVLLNFARGEIVDNEALLKALDAGQVARYASDFPTLPLKQHPKVICLPHLGASTLEAEQNCARMVAQQVQDYLEHGHIRNSVNFPTMKLPQNNGNSRLAIVNANVPNMVAQISTLLSTANINIVDMLNQSRGEIAYTLVDVDAMVEPQLIKQISAIDGVVRARVVKQKG